MAACAGACRVLLRALLPLIARGTVELLSWEAAEAKAEKTLARMTSEERHGLMRGVGWVSTADYMGMGKLLDGYYMGNTAPIPRLGVPALKLHDAGNGFRNNNYAHGTTISWPSGLSLASTWDEGLVEAFAAALGREFRGKGANVILGPGVQVHRVARNGRNFEYLAGDDPFLGSRLAAAYVRGVQGQGVMACAKHWAFNEQETDRMGGSSEVDERTAWELYYPPFEAAVQAGVGSFMCSYNRVNGTYACENEELLRRDLKQKMGFRGFVMSDWWAAHSQSVEHGLDQEMPGDGVGVRFFKHGPHFSHRDLELAETQALVGPATRLHRTIVHSIYTSQMGPFGNREAKLSGMPRDQLYKDPARRILAALYRLRIDEHPGCTPGEDCTGDMLSNQVTEEHRSLNKDAATRSVIMLKNNGVLPLNPATPTKVALIGEPLVALPQHNTGGMPPADYYSGGGSGHVGNSWGSLLPLQALQRRATGTNVSLLSGRCTIGSFGMCKSSPEEAVELAKQADVAVIFAATTATEGVDRANLNLDNNADAVIQTVALLRPTVPVVVLVQAPGAFVMPWRDDVAAIACLFLGGEETGHAWASILFGDASPAGKLPILLPKTEVGTIQPSYGGRVPYLEGLFTSYRAPSSKRFTAFPFGHGLSYTTFTYSALKQTPAAECGAVACVTVVVTNKGQRPGAEVAQAYAEFPKEADMPRLMLKGFHRTQLLLPGESETARFSFRERDLSVFRGGGWRLQESLMLHVAASSEDIRGTLQIQLGHAAVERQSAEAGSEARLEARPEARSEEL